MNYSDGTSTHIRTYALQSFASHTNERTMNGRSSLLPNDTKLALSAIPFYVRVRPDIDVHVRTQRTHAIAHMILSSSGAYAYHFHFIFGFQSFSNGRLTQTKLTNWREFCINATFIFNAKYNKH